MAFGGFERGTSPSQPMAEINVTPLVDVMLVLLVIFIITAPLLAYAIKLDLPNERGSAITAAPETIRLAIKADGSVYWNAEKIDDDVLVTRLAQSAGREPQPELHLRADRATHYERIAMVLAAAQQAGLARMGFVTEPDARKGGKK
jgi:biopolymer transport protein ExbD